MALEFKIRLEVPTIPSDARRAARAAMTVAHKVAEAGGFEPAVDAAVEAIYAVRPSDEPSELKRLRLIYQNFYTREEIHDLVRRNLSELGIKP